MGGLFLYRHFNLETAVVSTHCQLPNLGLRIAHFETVFTIRGAGELFPCWVWAKLKVLLVFLPLTFKSEGVWGAASPPKVLPLTFV
jgi:hypothetical protein